MVGGKFDRRVSSRTVGLTCLVGLVAFSIVGCFAYYPGTSEVFEEMRHARTEVLSGVTSREYDRALHWIPILEEWSRKLEVGFAIRNFELRPYQQMQAYLLRKKLENLEHAIEAIGSDQELTEIQREHLDQLRKQILDNSKRIADAFAS